MKPISFLLLIFLAWPYVAFAENENKEHAFAQNVTLKDKTSDGWMDLVDKNGEEYHVAHFNEFVPDSIYSNWTASHDISFEKNSDGDYEKVETKVADGEKLQIVVTDNKGLGIREKGGDKVYKIYAEGPELLDLVKRQCTSQPGASTTIGYSYCLSKPAYVMDDGYDYIYRRLSETSSEKQKKKLAGFHEAWKRMHKKFDEAHSFYAQKAGGTKYAVYAAEIEREMSRQRLDLIVRFFQ
jgi:uncharacterized protein YecT (DUF1311 family)